LKKNITYKKIKKTAIISFKKKHELAQVNSLNLRVGSWNWNNPTKKNGENHKPKFFLKKPISNSEIKKISPKKIWCQPLLAYKINVLDNLIESIKYIYIKKPQMSILNNSNC